MKMIFLSTLQTSQVLDTLYSKAWNLPEEILFKVIKIHLKREGVSLLRSLRGIEWPSLYVTRCIEQAVLHQLKHN